MQLNIKFNQIFAKWPLLAAGLSLLAFERVQAEPTPSVTVRSEVSKADTSENYRNGSDWIGVEREPGLLAGEPRQKLLLYAGKRVFGAFVGPHAIVQVAEGVAPDTLWRREGLRAVAMLSAATRAYLVAADSGEDGLQIASRLALAQGVVEAIPDLYVQRVRHGIHVPPNDPRYSGQWYLRKLKVESAWKHSTGSRDTTVVVIDDGCDLNHPDLVANMLEGIDAIGSNNDASYQPYVRNNSHGTHCAGLIAAQADNGIGIAGVCPECTLRCVRLLDNGENGVPLSADLRAFDYALLTGASVVSNSWGFADPIPVPAPLRNLIDKLYKEGRDGRGTVIVFSAGNENREIENDELMALPGIITVGAINNFDEATSFSNHGDSLYLTAPTGTITTDISGADGDNATDYTELFGGTSSACPVVAGVVGLVLSASPDLSAADARELLRATARKAPFAVTDGDGHDDIYGYGIVDPGAALRSVLGIEEEDEPVVVDAGADAAVGAAADAGADDKPTPHADSGCAVQRVRRGAADAAWFSAAGLVWVLACRRRRARRS
jgi:subtilisin family serine protease